MAEKISEKRENGKKKLANNGKMARQNERTTREWQKKCVYGLIYGGRLVGLCIYGSCKCFIYGRLSNGLETLPMRTGPPLVMPQISAAHSDACGETEIRRE